MKTNKNICLTIVMAGCIYTAAISQKNESLFPSQSGMPVGVYYYPEHWARDQWARDIREMADLLHKYCNKNQWITMNFACCKFLPPVDLFRKRPELLLVIK